MIESQETGVSDRNKPFLNVNMDPESCEVSLSKWGLAEVFNDGTQTRNGLHSFIRLRGVDVRGFRVMHLWKEWDFANILCSVVEQMASVREDDKPWAFLSNKFSCQSCVPGTVRWYAQKSLSAYSIHNLKEKLKFKTENKVIYDTFKISVAICGPVWDTPDFSLPSIK